MFKNTLLFAICSLTAIQSATVPAASPEPVVVDKDAQKYIGNKCSTVAQCGNNGFLVCEENTCQHKAIFPIQPEEITGTLVLTILTGMAITAGIGGGVIIVPLALVFFELEAKQAVPVSAMSIVCGSITRYIMTRNDRHPNKDAPCVEYALTNVMLPTVLIGSQCGVLMNIMFPNMLLKIILAVLLIFLTFNTGKKSQTIWNQETAKKAKEAQQAEEMKALESQKEAGDAKTQEGLVKDDENNAEKEEKPKALSEAEQQALDQIVENEKTHWQPKRQGINFSIFLLLAVVNLLRGSKTIPSIIGIEKCSWGGWTILVVYLMVCVAISRSSMDVLKYEQSLKMKANGGKLGSWEVVLEGNQTKLVVFSFCGGLIAGALGLGGSIIFQPLLLSMGVPPTVASATGMYMVLFSTGAVTVIYIIQGLILISYGLWIGCFCVVGTLMAMTIFAWIMKKLGRKSPLVMLLSFVLGLSAASVLYFGFKFMPANPWEFSNMCLTAVTKPTTR